MSDTQSYLLPVDQLPHEEPKRRVPVTVFQERLLFYMNKYGLSDAEVIRATGVAETTFHDWVMGRVSRPLADEKLLKVARLLGVSIEELISRENRAS